MCTHLIRRNGTYYFRRRIPEKLRAHFNDKNEISISLRTKDRREAMVLCRSLGLEWDKKFAQAESKPFPQLHGYQTPLAFPLSVPKPALRLEDVTPEVQHRAEQDLEMVRLLGDEFDSTGFALEIEKLPALWSLEEYTYACLLMYRRQREGMEGKDDLGREIFRDRLNQQLLAAEDVLALRRSSSKRMRYHEAERNALQIFLKGEEATEIVRYEKLFPGGLESIRKAKLGGVASPALPQSEAISLQRDGSPQLSVVVDDFLGRQDKSVPMFKKYTPVLTAFLEVVGDKPCSQLKQREIDSFFALLCRLPPRWVDEKRKQNTGLNELADREWPSVVSRKTFEDGYLAAFRPFLTDAKRLFGDEGFPRQLTTDGIRYTGNREGGENKQRAFGAAELRRLFEGEEIQSFVRQPDQAHCYWLPLIGLYTGARVNEVCQLNPQTDIRQENGIWFFDITADSEADVRVVKSVKNESSRRRVPVHSKLIELGLLVYVERIKRAGGSLLFPPWPPAKGRASAEAEKWFRRLLKNTGLRDETPGKRLVGYHAFRHTFLNYAMNNRIANAEWITGHAAVGVGSVVRGYQGEAELANKLEVLEQFQFEVEPPKPV